MRTTETRLDQAIADARRGAPGARVHGLGLGRRSLVRAARGLAELLRARGFVRAPRSRPSSRSSRRWCSSGRPAHRRRPPRARMVRDYDEYLVALRIAMKTFEVPEEGAAGWLAAAPELYKQQDGVTRMTLIAHVDGRPAGFAWAVAGVERPLAVRQRGASPRAEGPWRLPGPARGTLGRPPRRRRQARARDSRRRDVPPRARALRLRAVVPDGALRGPRGQGERAVTRRPRSRCDVNAARSVPRTLSSIRRAIIHSDPGSAHASWS